MGSLRFRVLAAPLIAPRNVPAFDNAAVDGYCFATQALAVAIAWYATVSAWRTTNELRMQMAEHVLGLDHEFHRSHTPGELIQRVDGDVTSVSDFLGQIDPAVPETAPIRERLTEEAEQLHRLATGAQERDRMLAMKSMAEDINLTSRGRDDKERRTRNRSKRDF